MPSTLKCSSDNRSLARACFSTCAKNFSAISPFSNRSRFLLNTVGTHTGSSMFRPTNQRNSRLYSSCSISIRSLRIVYNTCSSSARNSFSGAIEGRPQSTYSRPNDRDSPFKTTSTMVRIGRKG